MDMAAEPARTAFTGVSNEKTTSGGLR